MMKKHLLIQHNGTKPNGAEKMANWFQERGSQVIVFWAYHDKFPEQLHHFDACFITGRPIISFGQTR